MKQWESLRLIAITDVERFGVTETLVRTEQLLALCRPGTVAIQLRDHHLPLHQRLALGRDLRRLTEEREQALFVNDRLDLAVLLGADGVHLGERSVRLEDARLAFGGGLEEARLAFGGGLEEARLAFGAGVESPQGRAPSFWSCSAHELKALEAGPSAWLLSPILAERKGRAPLGLEALTRGRAELARLSVRPRLFALGGVRAGRAAECLRAGADGVAAIGAVWAGRLEPLLEELALLR